MTAEDNPKAEGTTEEKDDGPEDEEVKNRKRRERLEQNRVSARESRKRKKTMIEELQRTVITLSRENKELNDRNEQLRRQLMEIGAKYPSIVPLQAIMQGANAGQGTPQAAADAHANAAAAVAANPSMPAAPQQQQQAAVPVPAPGMVAFNPMQFWSQQGQAQAAQAAPAAQQPGTAAQPAPAPGQNV